MCIRDRSESARAQGFACGIALVRPVGRRRYCASDGKPGSFNGDVYKRQGLGDLTPSALDSLAPGENTANVGKLIYSNTWYYAAGFTTASVSYTHLDVYKRQE